MTKKRGRAKYILIGLMAAVLAAAGFAAYQVRGLLKSLPDEAEIRAFRPQESYEIADDEGRSAVFSPSGENRLPVELGKISQNLVDAVLISEDDTFFRHGGFNFTELWNSLVRDIEVGKFARGASTITQQLARTMFLTRDKTLKRKVQEAAIASEIEEVLPKEKILELYLNTVHWGSGIYGAESVARFYFDKPASRLNLVESVMLATALPNPKKRNLFQKMSVLQGLKKSILERMRTARKITAEEEEWAATAGLTMRDVPGKPGTIFPLLDIVKDGTGKSMSRYLNLAVLMRRSLPRAGGRRKLKTSLNWALQAECEAAAAGRKIPDFNSLKKCAVITDGGRIRALVFIRGTDDERLIAEVAGKRGLKAGCATFAEIPPAGLFF